MSTNLLLDDVQLLVDDMHEGLDFRRSLLCHSGSSFTFPVSPSYMPSSEAGAQHSKDNAGYDDVEVGTLPRKGQSGQCHTRHGCSCEQQEPALDDAATAQR